MNKRGKQFIFLATVLVFLLLSIKNTSALGISGTTLYDKIDFQPGLEKTYNFRVGTETTHPMNYKIYAKEDLAPYITTSISEIFVDPHSGFDFSASLKLPDYLSPGMHYGYICVMETEPMGGPGSSIGIKTEVCAVIQVKVLYPGKYLVINNFDAVVTNRQVQFILDVENLGTEDIISAKPFIDIFELNRTEKLASVEGQAQPVPSNTKATLTAFLDAGLFNVGDYLAKAIVNYDGLEANASKQFKIGELEVRLVNYTKEFEQDKISPMEIEVESLWNQEIKNVFVEVSISKNGEKLPDMRTPSETLPPWGRTILKTFFDTNGLAAGDYDASFRINYENKITESSGTIKIKERKLESPKLSLSLNTILLLIVLVLLILLILLVLRRKKRKEQQ